MKVLHSLLGAVAVALAASCSSSDDVTNPTNTELFPTISLSRGEHSALAQANSFGVRLFSALDGQKQPSDKGNTVFAPLGATMCYAMLANGADKSLQNQMLAAVGKQPVSLEELNGACHQLALSLPAHDPSAEVTLAQAAWSGQLSFLPSFSNAMQEVFASQVFTGEGTLLNRWCATQTNGRITEIFPTDESPELAVASAMSFEGKWCDNDKFDKAATTEQPFHGANGDTPVQMMHKLSSNQCLFCDDSFAAVALNFGNRGYRFILVLPEAGKTTLPEEALLQAATLNISSPDYPVMAGSILQSNKVDLYLPKFSLRPDQEISLRSALEAIGAGSCFEYQFTALASDNIPVNLTKIAQKTFFEIDEEGVKAASVTSAGGATAPGPEEQITLRFDRPFYFFLTETSTNAILMAGHITDL